MIQGDHVWRTQRRWLTRGVVRHAVGFAMLLAVFGFVVKAAPEAWTHWLSKASQRDLAYEAKRLALTYQDALNRPEWAKGKPVRWYVGLHGERFYYGHNMALPVRFDHVPPELRHQDNGKHGSGRLVVGLIAEAGPGGVLLTYKGSE